MELERDGKRGEYRERRRVVGRRYGRMEGEVGMVEWVWYYGGRDGRGISRAVIK